MKHIKQTFAAFCLSLLVTAAAVLSAVPVYAAGASITLVANKATLANGGSLIVAVYMNGGGNPINGVEADLSYPASKLQYVGVNYSGSAFEITASGGGGDGAISIDRGTTGSVSGSGLIATLTFKAIANSGSAAISVGGNSALVNSGTAVGFVPGGVSVNFSDYVAPAPSATAVTPTAPVAVAPPKDTTPPAISALKVKSLTPYTAVIDWTTDEPADSTVDYGLDTNYGLSASQPAMTTSHEISLASSFLTPKALLHYRVKSADAAGNVQTGTDQALQIPGVPVTIVVRGNDGQPQAGADVTLDNQTTTTGSNGQAMLSSSLGSKQVVITYGGVTIRRPIHVGRSAKPLPPYKLDLAKQPLNHWMLTSIGLIVVVLTLLALDAALFGSTFIMKLVRSRRYHAPIAASPAADLNPNTSLLTSLQRDLQLKPEDQTNITTPAAPISVPLVKSISVTDAAPTLPTAPVAPTLPETPAAAVAERLKPRSETTKSTTGKAKKIIIRKPTA